LELWHVLRLRRCTLVILYFLLQNGICCTNHQDFFLHFRFPTPIFLQISTLWPMLHHPHRLNHISLLPPPPPLRRSAPFLCHFIGPPPHGRRRDWSRDRGRHRHRMLSFPGPTPPPPPLLSMANRILSRRIELPGKGSSSLVVGRVPWWRIEFQPPVSPSSPFLPPPRLGKSKAGVGEGPKWRTKEGGVNGSR
jgi:hypothetical protein